MNVVLSPETQRLLEAHLSKEQFTSADEVRHAALQAFEQTETADYERLDADARAAIEQAEVEFERGEGRPWEELREELRDRFIPKQFQGCCVAIGHGARRQPTKF